jgi:hypothetical protein
VFRRFAIYRELLTRMKLSFLVPILIRAIATIDVRLTTSLTAAAATLTPLSQMHLRRSLRRNVARQTVTQLHLSPAFGL